MSFLEAILNLRFRFRADKRAERRQHLDEARDIRSLIEDYIENLERALALIRDKHAHRVIEENILQYRALKARVLEQQIEQHPGVVDRVELLGRRPELLERPRGRLVTIQTESVRVQVGSQFEVAVILDSEGIAVGAYTIDVDYDPKLLTALSCVPDAGGVCNAAYNSNTVRFVGASASGLVGTIRIGAIKFKATHSPGTVPLSLVVPTLADATYLDPRDLADALILDAGTIELIEPDPAKSLVDPVHNAHV